MKNSAPKPKKSWKRNHADTMVQGRIGMQTMPPPTLVLETVNGLQCNLLLWGKSARALPRRPSWTKEESRARMLYASVAPVSTLHFHATMPWVNCLYIAEKVLRAFAWHPHDSEWCHLLLGCVLFQRGHPGKNSTLLHENSFLCMAFIGWFAILLHHSALRPPPSVALPPTTSLGCMASAKPNLPSRFTAAFLLCSTSS